MSKRLIPQIYGYAVCLVAIITFVTVIRSFADNTFSYAKPASGYECGGYYPMPMGVTADAKLDASYYEGSQKQCTQSVKDRALRGMVNDSLVALISLALFIVHWRWITKMPEEK